MHNKLAKPTDSALPATSSIAATSAQWRRSTSTRLGRGICLTMACLRRARFWPSSLAARIKGSRAPRGALFNGSEIRFRVIILWLARPSQCKTETAVEVTAVAGRIRAHSSQHACPTQWPMSTTTGVRICNNRIPCCTSTPAVQAYLICQHSIVPRDLT
jgi:hypothetical protein